MHRVLQCNVRYGLQAILELELPVIAILTDGVITACGEGAYSEWYKRYTELKKRGKGKWKQEQWGELGYELRFIQHGCFGGWYPIKKEEENVGESN